jgi:hypothetical protein
MALGLKPWVQLKLVVLALSARCGRVQLPVDARATAARLIALGGHDPRHRARACCARDAGSSPTCRSGRSPWSRCGHSSGSGRTTGSASPIAAAATLLAYFTRSAGLPLVVAALGWLAWRRHWRQFGALAALIGVPALLVAARSRAFGDCGYVSEFWLVEPYVPALGRIGAGGLLQRIVENVQKYVYPPADAAHDGAAVASCSSASASSSFLRSSGLGAGACVAPASPTCSCPCTSA